MSLMYIEAENTDQLLPNEVELSDSCPTCHSRNADELEIIDIEDECIHILCGVCRRRYTRNYICL